MTASDLAHCIKLQWYRLAVHGPANAPCVSGRAWSPDTTLQSKGRSLAKGGDFAPLRSALLLMTRQGTGREPGLAAASSGGSAEANLAREATSAAHFRTVACLLSEPKHTNQCRSFTKQQGRSNSSYLQWLYWFPIACRSSCPKADGIL